MGCVLEFIFEIAFEAVFELFWAAYNHLMGLILPEHNVTLKARKRLKKLIAVYGAALIFSCICGIIFTVQEDLVLSVIGRYLLYVPLGLIIVQITAGMILRIFRRKR